MFGQFRKKVKTVLSAALSSPDLPTDGLGVEEPPGNIPAMFASSVAFRPAGVVGVPPSKIAVDIAEELSIEGCDYLAAADIQGPYVNFHISDVYYDDIPDAAAGDEAYGRLPAAGDSVTVKYTSANPTGPVHVDHTRNPVIGDTTASLLDFTGNDIDRHYYVNDAGRQMAVFTWAYETFDEDDSESESAYEHIECDLVRYYRKGDVFLEGADPGEVERAEVEITEILQSIEEGDEETYARTEAMADQVLGGMCGRPERLPAEFDEFARETRFMFGGSTRDSMEHFKETGHVVYKEGAWQFELDDYGFEKNLVFPRSDDAPLYTTHDFIHHEWKFNNCDRAMTVLDEDRKLQSGQLRAALDIPDSDMGKLKNVIYSWVNFLGGETMSTRKGTGVMLDNPLDEAIDHARDEAGTCLEGRARDDDLDGTDIDRITRQVDTDVVRYDTVSKQPTKTITSRWDQTFDFEAQSAPYIQYVRARCCDVVGEATTADLDASETDPAVLTTDTKRDLLATIARFLAAVETAAGDLEPRTVATSVHELAEMFSTFYRECPMFNADKEVSAARLAFVEASWNVVTSVFAIIGVEAPEPI